jgi:hypothetical protein
VADREKLNADSRRDLIVQNAVNNAKRNGQPDDSDPLHELSSKTERIHVSIGFSVGVLRIKSGDSNP